MDEDDSKKNREERVSSDSEEEIIETESTSSNEKFDIVANDVKGKWMGQRKSSYGVAFPCKHCSNSYKKLGTLTAHLSNAHPEKCLSDCKLVCDVTGCGKPFSSELGLKLHQAMHSRNLLKRKSEENEKWGECHQCEFPGCDHVYHTEFSLKVHKKSHEQVNQKVEEDQPNFPCEEPNCERRFHSEYALKRHHKTHVLLRNAFKKEEEDYEDFPKEDYEDEKKKASESRFVCPQCYKTYKHPYFYHQHLANCQIPVTRPFCTKCGQIFPTAEVLEKHQAISECASDNENEGNFRSLSDDNFLENIHIQPLQKKMKTDELIKDDQQLISSAPSQIEKSSLPLSMGVFSNASENPGEMMVIWSNKFDEDLFSAVMQHKLNTIVCVLDLDFDVISNEQKIIIKKEGDMLKFVIHADSGFNYKWTTVTFGHKIPPVEIQNKSFQSFGEVERIFSEHAGSHGMDIINMMRNSEEGLFRIASKQLVKKIHLFNCL